MTLPINQLVLILVSLISVLGLFTGIALGLLINDKLINRGITPFHCFNQKALIKTVTIVSFFGLIGFISVFLYLAQSNDFPHLRPTVSDLKQKPLEYYNYIKYNEDDLPVSIRADIVLHLYALKTRAAIYAARDIANGYILTSKDREIIQESRLLIASLKHSQGVK